MNYDKLKVILKSKGVVKAQNINRVCFHSQQETIEHFMIKSLLTYIIFSKGNGVITEAEFVNGRVVDVLQILPSGNCIGYEIEGTKNKKPDITGIDIIEINIKEIPYELKGNLKMLYDWIKVMVV